MEQYTDQVQINVKLNDRGLDEPPSEEWLLTINSPGLIDRSAVRGHVLDELKQDNYLLATTERSVNWGASGEILGIVMTVATGAGGAVLATNMTNLANRLCSWLPSSRAKEPIVMAEEDAIRAAKRHLCRRYDLEFDDLTAVATGTDFVTKQTEVELTEPGGKTYVTTIWKKAGGVELLKVIVR
ncbi:hypothetical protein ACWCPQ_26865 [Nocardia sp. NPDC001965]